MLGRVAVAGFELESAPSARRSGMKANRRPQKERRNALAFIPSMSGVQSCTGAFDEVVVFVARAAEVEDAGGEVTIAHHGRQVRVVFQDCRTEFVVVRIVALEEHQAARRVDKLLWIRVL